MRNFVLSFFLMASAVLGAEKPNVLFLFADDLTFEAIRSFGHTDIDTPNLDKLAASGKVFTHAYNMGSWSGAVCVASRTMLNTGRYVWRAQSADSKEDAVGKPDVEPAHGGPGLRYLHDWQMARQCPCG
jgi:arylsulfatase A-like enzyme